MNLKIKIEEFKIDYKTIFFDTTLNLNGPGLYCLVGKNGSGKTTLLQIITGQCGLNNINISLDDKKINIFNVSKYFDENITYVPQYPIIVENKTIYENISDFCPNADKSVIESLLKEFNFSNINITCEHLSSGEQQRINFIRAICLNKPIILFDEITSNIDYESIYLIKQKILKLSKSHLVIFATHLNEFLLEEANVIEIKNQKIITINSKKAVEGTQIIKGKDLRFSITKSIFSLFIFFFSLIIPLTISFTNSFYSASINQDKIVDLSFDNYVNKANAFYMLQSDYKDIKDRLTNTPCYKVNSPCLEFSSSNEVIGDRLSCVCFTTDFSSLPLIDGHLPTNSKEIVVSDVVYERLTKAGKNKLDTKLYEEFSEYTLVGVYKSTLNSNDKNILKNLSSNNSLLRDGLTFKVENAFSYDDLNKQTNFVCVEKSDESINCITKYNIFDFKNNTMFGQLLLNNNGDYIYSGPLYSFSTITAKYHIYEIVYFILLGLIIGFILKNQNVVLINRICGKNRNQILLSYGLSVLLPLILGFVLSFVLTPLVVCCFNLFIYQTSSLLPLSYIEINAYASIINVAVFALLVVSSILLINFFLAPKNINRQINEIKRR